MAIIAFYLTLFFSYMTLVPSARHPFLINIAAVLLFVNAYFIFFRVEK